jgi:enolase
MELTRKQVIEILEKADSTVYKEPKTKTAYALEYAISSLKTDEAYQLMYEGEEVFTKDEVVAMLTEIKDEASNICPTIGNCASFTEGIRAYDKLIQQKINSLKEDTNQ